MDRVKAPPSSEAQGSGMMRRTVRAVAVAAFALGCALASGRDAQAQTGGGPPNAGYDGGQFQGQCYFIPWQRQWYRKGCQYVHEGLNIFVNELEGNRWYVLLQGANGTQWGDYNTWNAQRIAQLRQLVGQLQAMASQPGVTAQQRAAIDAQMIAIRSQFNAANATMVDNWTLRCKMSSGGCR